jgi:hypothetical protein
MILDVRVLRGVNDGCPECGVVPSRFVDGDHEADCSRRLRCPICGADPNSMFHSAICEQS